MSVPMAGVVRSLLLSLCKSVFHLCSECVIRRRVQSHQFSRFAVIPSCLALYTAKDDVIELTEQNFKTRVINSDEVWIVEFYAPWYCFHFLHNPNQ